MAGDLYQLKLTKDTNLFATGLPSKPGAALAATSNAANALSGLCHWRVPDGNRYALIRPRLRDDVTYGENVLRPIFKLYDSGPVEAAGAGKIVLAVQRPVDDQPEPIGQVTYEDWRALTPAEQADRNQRDLLGFDFRMPAGMAAGDVLNLPAGSYIVLMADLDRSISFAIAAGTRIVLPAMRGSWAGGL